MKRAGKQVMKKMNSSDDEDSDVEKNFALLKNRGRGRKQEEEQRSELDKYEEDKEEQSEEDDEEGSDVEEEEKEDSDGGDDDEEEVVEGSDAVEEEEEEDEDESSEDEDESEEENAGCGEIQTSEDIKRELSNMSFEDILKLQNKVGTKVFNEVAHGDENKRKDMSKKKRLNKNRPMEMSSKKPAPFLRNVVAVRKTTLRDPRFDDLSGEYKPEIFRKTFKFIDDIKLKEKQLIQKQLKRTKKNSERKEKLQFLLKRMENQERARLIQDQQRDRELQWKKQQRERANQGAAPFYLRRSEKKKFELAEKYQELKKSGKLENFLNKKRKRNAGKDRRKLPQHLKAV